MSYHRLVSSKLSAAEAPSNPPQQTNKEWSATNKWGVAFTVAGVGLIALAGAAIAIYAAGKIPPGYHLTTKIAASVIGGVGLAGTIAGIVMMRHQSAKKEEKKTTSDQQPPQQPSQILVTATSPSQTYRQTPQMFAPQSHAPSAFTSTYALTPQSSALPQQLPQPSTSSLRSAPSAFASTSFVGQIPPPSGSLSKGRVEEIPAPASQFLSTALPTASLPPQSKPAPQHTSGPNPSAIPKQLTHDQWSNLFNGSVSESAVTSKPGPIPLDLPAGSPLNQEVLFTLADGSRDLELGNMSVQTLLRVRAPHKFASVKDQVVERLNQFHREIGIVPRIVDWSIRMGIKVGDLEAPWSDSVLRIQLMTIDQLQEVTTDEIASFPPRHLKVFTSRIFSRDMPQQKVVEVPDVNSHRITLAQLRELSPVEINAILPRLHPNVIRFLTEAQIKGLDTTKLNQHQFNSLFVNYDALNPNPASRISWLSISQVFSCIGHFDADSIKYLTKEQLRDKDFVVSRLPFPLFEVLFPEYPIDMIHIGGTRIRELRADQINDNLNLFSGPRLRGMSVEQIRDFNYTTPGFTQEHFDGIFPEVTKSTRDSTITEVRRRIQQLSKENLYQVWKWLTVVREGQTDVRIRLIDDIMFGQIDFKICPLPPYHFTVLFPKAPEDVHLDFHFQYTRLKCLKIGQVYDLLPLFDRWRMLVLPHHIVKAFDFVAHPLSDDQLDGLFSMSDLPVVQSLMHSRFGQLDVRTQLYPLIPRLSGHQLKNLPKDKFQQIDFSVCLLNKAQLDVFVPALDSNLGDRTYREPWAYSRMMWFLPVQLNVLIGLEEAGEEGEDPVRVLDGQRLFLISPEQLKTIDLTKLSDAQFEGLFRYEDLEYQVIKDITETRIRSLDVARVTAAPNWRRWEGRLACLSPDQISKIDFKKYPLTQNIFDRIFIKNASEGWSYVKWLSIEQIYALQNFFDEQRGDNITVEQVAKMDFTKVTSPALLKGMFESPRQGYSRLYQVKVTQVDLVLPYLKPGMLEAYRKHKAS